MGKRVESGCRGSYAQSTKLNTSVSLTKDPKLKGIIMDLCSDGHPEICYDEKACPMCDLETDLRDEIKELEKTVASQTEDIGELEDQIYTLTQAEKE